MIVNKIDKFFEYVEKRYQQKQKEIEKNKDNFLGEFLAQKSFEVDINTKKLLIVKEIEKEMQKWYGLKKFTIES